MTNQQDSRFAPRSGPKGAAQGSAVTSHYPQAASESSAECWATNGLLKIFIRHEDTKNIKLRVLRVFVVNFLSFLADLSVINEKLRGAA